MPALFIWKWVDGFLGPVIWLRNPLTVPPECQNVWWGPKLCKGAFIYDVRCFLGIFDLPTYPHQMLYYISLFSKIRWSLTYLPTQKSDVIYECSLIQFKLCHHQFLNKSQNCRSQGELAHFCLWQQFSWGQASLDSKKKHREQ